MYLIFVNNRSIRFNFIHLFLRNFELSEISSFKGIFPQKPFLHVTLSTSFSEIGCLGWEKVFSTMNSSFYNF